jgi:hypothetical protein
MCRLCWLSLECIIVRIFTLRSRSYIMSTLILVLLDKLDGSLYDQLHERFDELFFEYCDLNGSLSQVFVLLCV